MPRYRKLLEQVWNQERDFGEEPRKSATPGQIEKLKRDCLNTFHCAIPEDYLELLSISNGLEWNGVGIFASQRIENDGHEDCFVEGFVEANLDFRVPGVLDDHLIFAEDGTVFYVYQISTGEYQVIMSGGLTLLQTFDTFDDLICDALTSHL